ncbi:hypothetical protein [Chthonobacter rhizosphaerae]|uniref:hypothetical protein n=1 Tax=Chthonobacter rhizosphaerae TaxID=2735553 RepID=UPI0015EFB3F3|nr:hypothetical protein [Chthonobacter rhizosphaerae]
MTWRAVRGIGPVVVMLAASTAGAAAATPREDLVARWLETVTFGADLSIGGSNYDPALSAVTLSDVTIGKPGSAFRLVMPSMTIIDPRITATGDFAAHSLRVESLRAEIKLDPEATFGGTLPSGDDGPLVTTPVDVAVTSGATLVERLVTPLAGPEIAADATPIARGIAYARWLERIRADWAETNTLAMTTTDETVGDASTSYELVYASGLHDGRTERYGFNTMRQTTTVEGVSQTSTFGSGYGIGADFGAVVDALDPALYAGGKGDGIWRTAVQQYRLSDLTVETAGTTATISGVQVDGMKVRQTDRSILEVVGEALKDPAKADADPAGFLGALVQNAWGLFGVDGVTLSGFELKGPDVESLALAEFSLNGLDSTGVGSFLFRGFEMALPNGGGSGKFNQLTFGNLRFGSLAAFLDLAATGQEPTPAQVLDAALEGAPSLDFVELTGLSAETPLGTVSLDTAALTNGDYLKALARRVDLTLTNLVLPRAVFGDETLIQQLAAMEYDQVALSGGATVAWDTDRGRVHVEDVTVRSEDMAVVSADAEITGVPLAMLSDPEGMERRLDEVALVKASVTFGNLSIVERIFAMQAKEMNQDPDTFRRNFAGALPLMLGFLGDKAMQARYQGVLKAFFEDPKSLVATVRPDAPLPFSAMEQLQADGFGPVADALNLEVRANE